MKKSATSFFSVFIIFISFISFFANQLCAQSPGALDPNFGDNGVVMLDVPMSGNGNALITQTDGKILVAGESGIVGNRSNATLFRFHPDGSPDTSFGSNGSVETNLNGWESFHDLHLQPDGKILAAGIRISLPENNADFLLIRYNEDGSVDNSFGNNGTVITDISGEDDLNQRDMLEIQPDGKILLVGFSKAFTGIYDIAILRYNTDGSLDNDFGENGLTITDLGGAERGFSLALLPSGAILVAGTIDDNQRIALLRYTSMGELDTSFGTEGIITTNVTNSEEGCRSLAIQTDGKILLTGTGLFPGWVEKMILVRYNEDGSLDAGFGDEGVVVSSYERYTWGNYVTLQPDDKILVTGFINTGSDHDIFLSRFLSDGTPDNSFGPFGAGVVTLDFGNWDFAFSLAMQDDGKILLSGRGGSNSDTDLILARFFSGLMVVGLQEWENNGVQSVSIYPNPVSQQAILEYKLDKGSEIQVHLLSMDGRYLKTLLSDRRKQGLHKEMLYFPSSLSAGNYILYLKTFSGSGMAKFHYTGTDE